MNRDPFDFLFRIEGLATEAELVTAFSDMLTRLGFDAVTYGAGPVVNGVVVEARIASTLSPAWIAHYADHNFYRSDRLVGRALGQITPFTYAEVLQQTDATAVQHKMENTPSLARV